MNETAPAPVQRANLPTMTARHFFGCPAALDPAGVMRYQWVH